MLLAELVHALPVRGSVPARLGVDAITVDHREVVDGSLYVARRGYYGDGHDRIAAAIAAGASALLVSDAARVPAGTTLPVLVAEEDGNLLGELSARFYRRPTERLTVYGVTGTNGKTSVTYLLEHLLTALGERPAVMGTVSYRYGARAHPACNTTPDALFVHRFARRALDAGARSLVLEVSSHALALGRVAGVHFARVGFTNLSHEHLDFHGTMADYRRTKERLFREELARTRTRGEPPLAAAVVSDEVGWGMLCATPTAARRVAVSVVAGGSPAVGDGGPCGTPSAEQSARAAALTDAARLRVELLESRGLRGYRFRVVTDHGAWTGETALIGRHNLANIALALALVAADDGERVARAVAAVASFRGIPGRLEPAAPVATAARAVFVDYAHTPDAVRRALETFEEVGARPVTIVLGSGGDRDPSKRGPMARAARLGADRVILTSDNPRSEEPDAIVAPMRAAFAEPMPDARAATAECEIDRARAIERAVRAHGTGPVLIAGKGHERYQERGGRRYRFDDREQARLSLVGLALGLPVAELPLWCGWSQERAQAVCGAAALAVRASAPGLPIVALRFEPAPERRGTEPLARWPVSTLEPPGVAVGEATAGCSVLTIVEAAPGRALRQLAHALLADAAVSVGGLWTLGLLPSPRATARAGGLARVARSLATLLPAERARIVVRAPSRDDLAGATALDAFVCLAGLTVGDRGLLIELPPAAVACAGAPSGRGADPWPTPWVEPEATIDLDAALELDAEAWRSLIAAERERTRRRFEGSVEHRPVPVPETLRLEP